MADDGFRPSLGGRVLRALPVTGRLYRLVDEWHARARALERERDALLARCAAAEARAAEAAPAAPPPPEPAGPAPAAALAAEREAALLVLLQGLLDEAEARRR